jgi:hypothetical protein
MLRDETRGLLQEAHSIRRDESPAPLGLLFSIANSKHSRAISALVDGAGGLGRRGIGAAAPAPCPAAAGPAPARPHRHHRGSGTIAGPCGPGRGGGLGGRRRNGGFGGGICGARAGGGAPTLDTHSEGFSYFVTSIAAPAASGRSGRRVGLAPTAKHRLSTAHTLSELRPRVTGAKAG